MRLRALEAGTATGSLMRGTIGRDSRRLKGRMETYKESATIKRGPQRSDKSFIWEEADFSENKMLHSKQNNEAVKN